MTIDIIGKGRLLIRDIVDVQAEFRRLQPGPGRQVIAEIEVQQRKGADLVFRQQRTGVVRILYTFIGRLAYLLILFWGADYITTNVMPYLRSVF